ncbi:hypothetical protein [Rufibacter hautae]|uniref:Uncharacterized protein n=1 Tax=Rufibacter hautae TaxID=2595005 RepID=A0A5B6TDD7_9BACT|nr:hypothetical protein [Rufibacter hautae]KAA3438479.1 hypothetical protein FOA19_14690 [Rufibacter hautae]
MADMKETAIFELKIDAGASEKRIAELTTDLIKAKEAKAALDKQYKAGELSAEEYGKQTAENKRATTALTTELGAETKILAMHTKQTKEAVGSNNQMRAQLLSLTQQYNALSKEERENAEIGGVLQKQIRELSDALKENESAVGDNRRNVGNYAGSILQEVDGNGLLATVTQVATGARRRPSPLP